MDWVIFGIFILGWLLGGLAAYLTIFIGNKVGTIRVDRSDPEEPPYLFLEVDRSVRDITSKKYVVMKVDVKDYISHK